MSEARELESFYDRQISLDDVTILEAHTDKKTRAKREAKTCERTPSSFEQSVRKRLRKDASILSSEARTEKSKFDPQIASSEAKVERF